MKQLIPVSYAAALIAVFVFPLSWPLAFSFIAIAALMLYTEWERSRIEENKVDLSPLKKELEAHEKKIKALESAQADVSKIADETKRLLTQSNVGLAFRSRALKKE